MVWIWSAKIAFHVVSCCPDSIILIRIQSGYAKKQFWSVSLNQTLLIRVTYSNLTNIKLALHTRTVVSWLSYSVCLVQWSELTKGYTPWINRSTHRRTHTKPHLSRQLNQRPARGDGWQLPCYACRRSPSKLQVSQLTAVLSVCVPVQACVKEEIREETQRMKIRMRRRQRGETEKVLLCLCIKTLGAKLLGCNCLCWIAVILSIWQFSGVKWPFDDQCKSQLFCESS